MKYHANPTTFDETRSMLHAAKAQEVWDLLTDAERLHGRDAKAWPHAAVLQAEMCGYHGDRITYFLGEIARKWSPPRPQVPAEPKE